MLQNVSWSQYFTILLVATVLYYFFLWLIVFKGKLNFIPSLANRNITQGEDTPDEKLTTAQFIMDELRPLFPNRGNKNELIQALQSELKRYAGWDDPSFRETINRFIINESQSKCSIRLGEDDLRVLWE
jgi:hypothetical protein